MAGRDRHRAGARARTVRSPTCFPNSRRAGSSPCCESVLARGTVRCWRRRSTTICSLRTPRALGTFDRMQQHVTIGPLREDGRIVGLVVTIEDVTSRIERERQAAGTQSNDAGTPPAAATHDDADVDVADPAAGTRGLAGHGGRPWRRSPSVAMRSSMRWSARFVSSTTTSNVLSSALDLLAISDIDVIEPLVRCLEDDDANLRIQAALILGERRDRRAIPALIARLSDPDVERRVSRRSRRWAGCMRPTPASALVAVAEQRDFFLAFPAIQALSRLGDAGRRAATGAACSPTSCCARR